MTPVIYPLLQPQQRVTKVRAFSSGGERFPDTEEVTSSNLVTPTTKSAPRRSPPAGRFFIARANRGVPFAPVPNGTHPMAYSRREARLGPKAPRIPGYGSNLLPYPGSRGGARRSGSCPAASIVSRPFPVRVSPASGEKRPRFRRVASWSRFFTALRAPRRLLSDIVLRGVP